MNKQTAISAKRAARELLDSFPDNVSWEEIAYHMEFRASIEAGLKDIREGRTISHEEAKKRFGIS